MTFATFAGSHIHLANDRVSKEDSDRQEHAAGEVLRRLQRQPGVILADEVGMGKTFVALAVSASILLERPDEGPVVVMAPPSLREKWPNDWKVFKEACLAESIRDRFRSQSADSGIQFLNLLDQERPDRPHIIFLTHGALHRTIGSGFAKLAMIRRAFKGRSSLADQRRHFARFAGKILLLDWFEKRAEGLLGELLDRHPDSWLWAIERRDPELAGKVLNDLPPNQLVTTLDEMEGGEFGEVVEALRSIPLRESSKLEERLKAARQEISAAMDSVWRTALKRAKFTSPLLVLDEAHHLKNPTTRLVSLFASEESLKDSDYFETTGPLGGKFERMLFLTATPFQLGHEELVRVLQRFDGIDWRSPKRPAMSFEDFNTEIKQVGHALDRAQADALQLDHAWGRLSVEDVPCQDDEALNHWWKERCGGQVEGQPDNLLVRVQETSNAIKNAERVLTPWVLRHIKDPHLPGHADVLRRKVLIGDAIRDGGNGNAGLSIPSSVLLPFLLAGRAQARLAASKVGRAYFADGLASSFEAYLETRSGRCDADEVDLEIAGQEPGELEWYLEQLDRALPRSSQTVRSFHPKILATCERAIKLWRAGEKVLIFCHYRATGRALRRHISARLEREILSIGQEKLPGSSIEEVRETLSRVGGRFFNEQDAVRRATEEWLHSIVGTFPKLTPQDGASIVDVLLRFIRTPSFLVRFVPLNMETNIDTFSAALESGGGSSLRANVEHFCDFLANRCFTEERTDFLAALQRVQPGTHVGKEAYADFDAGEANKDEFEGGTTLLPNVRLANGGVKAETRRRLLKTFNTPLFPEILIASSVLGEGVDLHLNCRYVIHHDLCWNPSTLEQRSGRVDRIGSKAERVGQSINLFMPYLGGTQDEKMFRVVRDRERWFQIVMGEKYEADEQTIDRTADRVPLPSDLQQQLTMRLHL